MPRNLSAEISADASDFIASVEAAADRTDNLGDQANQASERVENLGDKSNTTATSVSALGAVVTSTSAAMSGLALATSASLIPALGALSATAVPLTATLGGLATAAGGVAAGFGAVIGTGLLAFGEQAAEQNKKRVAQIKTKIERLEKLEETTNGLTESQKKQLATLKEQKTELKGQTSAYGALVAELKPAKKQFRESALAIGQEFIPLIRDAISALPEFIRQIERSIGDLTPFAAALRDAGQAAAVVVPKIVEQIMDMGRDALPAVRSLGGAIADNAVPALQAMASTTDTVVGIFDGFGTSIGNALPKINQLGIGVLEEVVPALQTAGSAAGDVVNKFNSLTTAQQETAAKAALVAPAIGTIATRLGAINPVLGAVTAAVGALGVAWTQNIGDIRTKTNQLVANNTKYDSLADAVRGMADSVVSAFNDAKGALVDFIDGNEGVQTAISETNTAISQASSAIATIAGGEWKQGFGKLNESVQTFYDGYRNLLVGSGGSGGLTEPLESAISDANSYLQGKGKQVFNDALDGLVETIVAVFQDAQTIMIGPSGRSGVMNTLLTGLAEALRDTGPKLLGSAAEAIGTAIRKGIIDLLKPLSGENSAILDTLADAANFIIKQVPQLFLAVGEGIVDSITEGVKGLYRGLVGNSVLKDQIVDAANWLVNNIGQLVGSVGDAIVSSITGAIQGAADSITSAVKGGIPSALSDFAGGVASSLQSLGDSILNKISGAINGAAGSITSAVKSGIPSALGDFAGGVASSLQSLGDSILNKISGAINGAAGSITSAVKSGIPSALGDFAGGVASSLQSLGDSILNKISGAINGAAGSITSAIKSGIPSALGDFAGGLVSSLQSLGRSIVNKISGAMNGAVGSITSAVKSGIPSALSDFSGAVASSLKSLGGGIVDKVARGTKESNQIEAELSEKTQAAINAAKQSLQGFLEDPTLDGSVSMAELIGGAPDSFADIRSLNQAGFSDEEIISQFPGDTIAEVISLANQSGDGGDGDAGDGGDGDAGDDDDGGGGGGGGGSVGGGPRVRSIRPPGGVGLAGLATGGLIEESGAAIVHAGERLVPAAQVADRGPAPVTGGGFTIENMTVNASGRAEGREAGRAIKRELKRQL